MVRLAHSPQLGQLGRVTLKACLGAICGASPELVLDNANDYIVYAVDPEESHRALQRSPTHRVEASPSRRSMPQVLVGKGFFSGGLEEPGEGSSAVTGRVRSEARQSSAFSSDEDEAAVEVLEVVLRMKEAPQRSREQYRSLMQGMGEGAETPSERRSATPHAAQPSPTTTDQRQLMSMLNVIAGALPERSSEPARTPAPPQPRTDRICYNCGARTSKSWRMLQLPAGESVNYPASERPPSDAVPLTWTPKFSQHTKCAADGETRWQACNPCGLYFNKYNVSRPDHFGGRGEKKKDEPRPPKKIKTEKDTPQTRAKQLGRTLSAVANRDAARLQRDQALQEMDRNTSPVRRTAVSSPARNTAVTPSRSLRMPPPQSSPSRSVRAMTPGQYGVPSYLINSSPGTAISRLMSEQDLDFEEMHPSGEFPTPGQLLRTRPAPTSPSPVRRSPRKRPHGTHCGINPYATLDVARSDPGVFSAREAPPSRSISSPGRQSTPPPQPASPGVLTRSRARKGGELSLMGMPTLDDEMLECPASPSVGRAQRGRERRSARADDWAPPSPSLGLSLVPQPQAMPLESNDVFSESTSGTWLDPSVLAAWDASRAGEAQPVVRRKPLPATVEDASSSQHSSPSSSPDSVTEGIEETYELLEQYGIHVGPDGTLTGNLSLGDGEQSINLNAFNGIELHNAPAFSDQLREFTESGSLGFAAHLGTHTPHDSQRPTPAALPAPDGQFVELLDDPAIQEMLSIFPPENAHPPAHAPSVASS